MVWFQNLFQDVEAFGAVHFTNFNPINPFHSFNNSSSTKVALGEKPGRLFELRQKTDPPGLTAEN